MSRPSISKSQYGTLATLFIKKKPHLLIVYLDRLRVLSVLRYWVDNFYDDFRQSPDLMEMLMNFLDNIVGLSGNKQFVTQIKTALEKKREGLERMRIIVKQPPPPALLPEGWPMGGRWTLMDVEPVEVARQLSLLALELLQNIQPAELLGAAWTKADKLVRSPNVMKSIQHFNKVGNKNECPLFLSISLTLPSS